MTTIKNGKRAIILTLGLLCLAATGSSSRIINGKPVAPGEYREVIQINSDGSSCTATIVGPRVILTTAHCFAPGQSIKFTVDGRNYVARGIRSPLYPSKDHDVGIGIVDTEVEGVEPASVGGQAKIGKAITLLGFGCTVPGGGGGNDGILREGSTVITSFSNFDMVSRMPGGATLCFGDSGGPAYLREGKQLRLIGIGSKGNIQDVNYHARMDITESLSFLKQVATEEDVVINGINDDGAR